MAQKYKRPPIAEAVFELRFGAPTSRDALDQFQKKMLDEYPAPPQQGVALNVAVGEAGTVLQQQFETYKLTSADGADVLILGMNMVATSRLAPYEGWEPFIARAKENFDRWKRAMGYQKIARIGVRYLNRIDVPSPEGKGITVGEYLKALPLLPNFSTIDTLPMETFALNAIVPLGIDNCKLILNVGSAPSPLVRHTSFILDLDISREVDLPQRDEDLWALADRIRAHKNVVFETCITDESRRLFSQ